MTHRRDFLKTALIALAVRRLNAAGSKPMRGIFPIVQTPYTSTNQLDTATLAKEIKFLDQCGVHGVVWPQLASEWSELSPDERFAGAQAIMEASKNTRCAVVLGVQGPDAEAARRYARQAEKLGPDAIIALPPHDTSNLDRVVEYYRAIAKECALPLFVQAVGDMSIDFVLRMRKEIPSLRYVKDEAGHTLSRISEYQRVAPDLGVFTGGHGKTMLDELARGASGDMPAASFADLYVQLWNSWHGGQREQAMEDMARISLLVNQLSAYGMPSLKYILYLRGVFPNWRCRGKSDDPHFDAEAQRSMRQTWEFAHKLLERS
jgi:dihydrodipicolinate synthase/N-acetylneuraminate lyase